ncbi:hypothetical protein ABE65_019410 [Fictibacillus phosphorivorans]|uniref:Uncharacterized protein n=1 Tax=Fictibacillus phosphorivorans TaxID=1221500 RepID=A0A160IRI2_9BACL|nr:hypothetical protein [Fictibacillus phosphorivorans]ANC78850.1 hypothetical protein ABE65_019410 [Fictibacillus phosphorivorans]
MEKKLKDLRQTLDQQISTNPVFTKKDEENILLSIRNSSFNNKVGKRKNTFLPKLLTAALFAGIVFTSYTLIDTYLEPQTAIEIKKENKKPKVHYAQKLTQASSTLSFEVSKRELTISGTVVNTTNYNSEPVQAKVNILDEDVAKALGAESLIIETPTNQILKPDESYSFKKVVTVDLGIIDENTFKDAVEVEIYSKENILTSFVINDITYLSKEEKEVESQEENTSIEEKNVESTDTPDNTIINEEVELAEESAIVEKPEEIKEQKKTPFDKVNVSYQGGKYYFNGVTTEMTLEETVKVLGLYDQKYISEIEYDAQSTYSWKTKINDSPPYEFLSINYMNQNRAFTLSFYLKKKERDALIQQLGKPYHIHERSESVYFYSESSKQLLDISRGIAETKDLYRVDLRIKDDPSYLRDFK